jgi:membrane protease YdiL (CAAX protease family)
MAADAEVPGPAGVHLGRRYLVVLAVVGAWMLTGFVFHMTGNAYLILGVPLLYAFQTLVARRPVSELWFKRPAVAPVPSWAWAVAAAFMVFPCTCLVREWGYSGWDVRLWYCCAIAGSVPLAMSIARFSRKDVGPLLLCLATAGVLGILFVAVPNFLALHLRAASAGAHGRRLDPRLREMARSLALYVPVVFILEEVFFRGGLDSYLHRSDDRDPWISAGFVSALWGLWHLPLVLPGLLAASAAWAGIIAVIIALVSVHYAMGVFLTMGWRRSGLLLIPAFVHAFVDAVRNGLSLH